MSKLADRIRRASRVEPAPLGFAAAVVKAKAPTLLVIARIGDPAKVTDAIDGGADAVIVEAGADRLRGAKLPDGAILGATANGVDRTQAAALREAGADFLLIEESSRAEALLDEKLGFVMAASSELDDTRLRLLGDLNLDALLVRAPEGDATVARVLDLRRIAGMGRAPLLVEADAGSDASLLQVLRESGTAGVVVAESAIGQIPALKERITSLPARGSSRKKTEEHADVLVPASAQSGGHDDDDEYDD